MRKKLFATMIVAFFLLTGCKQSKVADAYTLQASGSFLEFPIDTDTRFPQFRLWTFADDGTEYLTFYNDENEILFYELLSGKLIKRCVLIKRVLMEWEMLEIIR